LLRDNNSSHYRHGSSAFLVGERIGKEIGLDLKACKKRMNQFFVFFFLKRSTFEFKLSTVISFQDTERDGQMDTQTNILLTTYLLAGSC
jgi:hypothetical protein